MRLHGISVPVLVLVLCILAAGCSSDVPDDLPTTPTPLHPATTTIITVSHPATVQQANPVVSTTTVSVMTPGPVQVLPAERRVNLVLTKDRPTSEIHLLYQGGPGEIYTSRVMMRVYTTDTQYTEYIMDNGAKPIPGDEIIAPGTRSGDRCEVFIISAGTRYRVIDENVYGGMYY